MLGTIDIKGAYKIEILVNLITYQFYLTKFQVIPEFHMISHHKSVAKTCYVVARDMLFFCFSHRSRTVFLGMPIRVCLHLLKIIFKAQWGWPCWRIFYCCKKKGWRKSQTWNPTIFNIMRWFAGSLWQMTHQPSIWGSSKHFFFYNLSWT